MKVLLVCLALSVPLVALGADSNPDAAFYKKAAEGGMAEVELGMLAQQKATDPRVKEFGAMMVKDHTTANDKLKAIAVSKNVTLPSHSSVGQVAAKTKLEMLTGSAFEQAYIHDMIADHEEDIREFTIEADSGLDADVKTYAAATLPTLQAHLKRIQLIAAGGAAGSH